jgi:hypothetical protein
MILFILGAQKTATSRVALMLNCQPGVFIAYEWQLQNGQISRHARSVLSAFPEARHLFRGSGELAALYTGLREFLARQGRPAEIVGDKLPGVDPRLLSTAAAFKVIFTVRDIRTWLCKDDIQRKYVTAPDAVPAAVDYTAHFLRSFLLPEVLRLRMEEVLSDNRGTLERIGGFIGRDLCAAGEAWWERVAGLKAHPLHAADPWWEGRRHGSAAIAAGASDTIVTPRPHPFWDALLPVFDKYYGRTSGGFAPQEVAADIARVEALAAFSPLPLETLYADVRRIELVADDRPLKKRLKRRIRERLRALTGADRRAAPPAR